jgi:hypothetical protein
MIGKLFDYMRGRHTAFAVFFAAAGTAMQWFHKLDGNYIALVTVIQGWVFARAASEDRVQINTTNISNAQPATPPSAPTA